MSGFVIVPFYDERRKKWRLLNGDETFYNDRNEMMEWESKKESLDWWFQVGPEIRKGFDRYRVVESGQIGLFDE